jgi:hypothetical protein
MRTKSSSAAMKEYLRAAAKMEAEMSTSCSSSEAPAQTSAAVSATAAARLPLSPFSAGGPLPEAAQVTSSRPSRVRQGPVGILRIGRGRTPGRNQVRSQSWDMCRHGRSQERTRGKRRRGVREGW